MRSSFNNLVLFSDDPNPLCHGSHRDILDHVKNYVYHWLYDCNRFILKMIVHAYRIEIHLFRDKRVLSCISYRRFLNFFMW